MSAAATAAGYLYASGRLPSSPRRRQLRRLEALELAMVKQGIPAQQARALALEQLQSEEIGK